MSMPKKIRFQAKDLTIVVTALVFMLCIATAVGVAWFTRYALKTDELPTEATAKAKTAAETIDLDLLSKTEELAGKKIARPIPDFKDLHDPYRTVPAAPIAPSPTPPPAVPPAEEPPAETPAQ